MGVVIYTIKANFEIEMSKIHIERPASELLRGLVFHDTFVSMGGSEVLYIWDSKEIAVRKLEEVLQKTEDPGEKEFYEILIEAFRKAPGEEVEGWVYVG